jgi:hypothetical protein
MLKRKSFIIGAVLALVMVLGVAGCTSDELKALKGTLQKIDSVSGNLTVKLQDGSTQTFNFTDVKIDTIRQTLGNATLEVGDQVTVRLHKNGDLTNIAVNVAEVRGVIKSLGSDNVAISTEHNVDITLRVTPDISIVIDGKNSPTFADLKVGQEIEAKYNVSTMIALRIHLETTEEGRDIDGIIKSLDSIKKTITITTNKHIDTTLLVTSDTAIFINDKGQSAFSDFQVGQRVEANYDLSSMNALKITVEEQNGNAWGKGHDNGKGND